MDHRLTPHSILRNPRLASRLLSIFVIALLYPAIAIADDVQQVTEDSKRLLKRAEKLIKQGDYPAAEKIFRTVSEIDPKNSEVKLRLAYSLLKQRRLVDAYEVSFAVAKEEPKNSHAYAVLGTTLLSAGRLGEAREVLFAALKLNRREALAWAGFGQLEFFENRIDESLRNLREAVYHDNDEPDYVFALAQVSARAEKYAEAADSYNMFLRIAKDLDHDRRDRIKGLVNFLRYLSDRERLYQSSGPSESTVSFDLTRNRPVIELKINDHEAPLRFVLDTGSGISVISEETSKKLNIRPITKGGYAKGIGGDGRFEIVYGFLRTVGIGDIKVRNVPVYIRKFHSNNQIDGYIGLAVISKFVTTIDYGNQTFTIAERGSVSAVPATDGVTVPLRLTSSGFLSGEVQLEGVESPLNFIVDTGASVSVISDEVANLDAIDPFEQRERMRVIGAAGVTEDVPSYLLPRVSLGANSIASLTAIALDLDMINEASGFEQAGILGGNFLRNYRMTFDVKNSQVTFVPIEKVP